MRTLARNQQTFYYALYLGKRELVDEFGNPTGEYEVVYDKPQMTRGNISASKGTARTNLFGEALDYDRSLIPEKNNLPLNEFSVLWIDIDPEFDAQGNPTTPFNFLVRKVARSLNSVQYALKQVDVGG